MGPCLITNPEIRSQVSRWFVKNDHECLIEIYVPHSGSSATQYFIDCIQLFDRMVDEASFEFHFHNLP